MRDGLLSIGELARMKGVGVKSLRYYESIGIFPPAFVDPSSGYRYYSLNQLMDLDAITTCIELGIPLKELRGYMEPSGMLNLAALLERGKMQALARIAEAQAVLAQVSAQLDEINAQTALSDGDGPYERRMGDRMALIQEWEGSSFDVRRYARWMTEAYETAKRLGAVPSYLQGFLFEPVGGSQGRGVPEARGSRGVDARDESVAPNGAAGRETRSAGRADVRVCTYLEILPVGDRAANSLVAAWSQGDGSRACFPAREVCVCEIPGGAFSGRRIVDSSLARCFAEAFDIVRSRGVRAVATEVWDAHLDPNTYVVELLVEKKGIGR